MHHRHHTEARNAKHTPAPITKRSTSLSEKWGNSPVNIQATQTAKAKAIANLTSRLRFTNNRIGNAMTAKKRTLGKAVRKTSGNWLI
jgi:hypothetical protein